MGLGNEVNKYTLDAKSAEAVISLRSAFDKIETIAAWLTNHPQDGENDPLVSEFDYTPDEAYVLRVYFETFESIRLNNISTFNIGRKITGLE